MMRRNLSMLAALAVILAWGTDAAQAERLGGAYRGPSDQKADSAEDVADDEAAETVDTGQDHKGSTESEGGLGSGDGGGEGGGGGGEEGGGGENPPPEGGGESGAPESGIGGEAEGPTAGNETGPATEGGDEGGLGSGGGGAPSTPGGGGGGPGGGGGGRVSIQKQFQRVLWYFEHNREHFMNEVAAKKNSRVPPLPYTAVDYFSSSHWDYRDRTPMTSEDRQKVFDLVKKQATLSDHSVVRDAAVIALGKIGTEEAVEVLIDRLGAEPRLDVQQDILLALGLSRSDKALETLPRVLKSQKLASYACVGLGLTGDTERAGKVVHTYFKSNLRSHKKLGDQLASAALALGQLRYEGAVGDLSKVVKSKNYDDVIRVYAAQALGRIGGDKARKALLSALNKSSNEVERAAALALGDFEDAKVLSTLGGKAGLGSADPLASGFAAMSMARIMGALPESDWKKYPAALRDIAMKPAKDQIKAQYANLALAVFGGFDKETRAFVTEGVAGTKMDKDTQSALAMACGVAGLAGSESALLELANSSARDDQTRCYAAMAYGMVAKDSQQAAKNLQSIYGKAKRPNVMRGALFGLGLVGDRKHVCFLTNAIKNKSNDRFTRGAAAAALGMIRDGRSIGVLEKLLGSSDKHTRAFAVAALGFLADKDLVPVLPEVFARNNFRKEFRTLQIVMATL